METKPFRFGLETLLEQPEGASLYDALPPGPDVYSERRFARFAVSEAPSRLSGKRIALLAHPASVDGNLTRSAERLSSWLGAGSARTGDGMPGADGAHSAGGAGSGGAADEAREAPAGARLTALFGPQHGIRGEKQDNMIESASFTDPDTGLPAFSLYGETRRLTPEMADSFDVLLVDLQDVGVRVYTFLTTMCYLLEDLERLPAKELWVLDRPNPTGRAVEGFRLLPGWESFVGTAPVPMQHGLTLGEFALWYHARKRLAGRLTVVPMTGWRGDNPKTAWPADRVWVQPSPNMPGLYTARAYPGTVMVEGTRLSEGRGTTRPLSTIGHPAIDWRGILAGVGALSDRADGGERRNALAGCRVREIAFEPTFHKHTGVLTRGIEIVAEGKFYDPERFRPYRLVAAILKMIRLHYPDLELWSDPPYEYEVEKRPIDIITGGTRLREWVEDRGSDWTDLEGALQFEEEQWRRQSAPWRIYG